MKAIETRKLAHIIVLATSILFLGFSFLHPFLHDHDYDGAFHDDCISCHFALTVSSLWAVIIVFVILLILIGFFENKILNNLINKFLPLTKGRAPPLI